jgi:uncharacterized protein (TIGR03118 family)
MLTPLTVRRRLLVFAGALALSLSMVVPIAAFAHPTTAQSNLAARGFYQQTNLVSDLPGAAKFTDPNLVNPWGLARSISTPWWVADNNAGVSTLYNGQGKKVALVVSIPPPGGSPAGTLAAPTGVVFNSASGGFVVSKKGHSGPARFIFATEDGTISAWSPTVDMNHAILTVDRSKVGAGAVYKGLAIASDSSDTFIYATNFRFARVEMFSTHFKLVGSFTDHSLPKGYAPFGIQNIGGNLYVTFALQKADRHDDAAGPGHGFVDVFNPAGNLVRRLISHGQLNSPWGLALAPADFGAFSQALLVGNFGNGHIQAYDPHTGAHLGQLSNHAGAPLAIDDLWGLSFGNGVAAGKTNELFFSAGIRNEKHGLFGSIEGKS